MSVITSLLLTSSVATWIAYPFNFIMLALDGIVYSLVAYSYRIFMLMAQLNFNVIYAWVSPLIDRIKAVILVVIMFKLGMSFIQYMVTPEKFDDAKVGGPALIKNIFISALLLVSYSLIFSVMNELSLLIIGVPEGYTFTTLNDLAGVENTEETDNGLLARFIFGKDSDSIEDFGKNLSVMTLSVFLHSSTGDASAAEKVYSTIQNSDSDFDFMEITTLASEIWRTVDYKWPLISTAMGIYLIFSIVKMAIEVGVRMFKLIILQILAPIAIITIISGGMQAKVWSNYINTLWKTFLDIFIRVGSLFLVTAFISKFYTSRSELFKADSFTGFLVLLIVIIAGYRLAMLLPAWLDSIFGSKLAENNKNGLGKALGLVGGSLVGGIGGLAAGRAAGLSFGQTLAVGARGMIGGGADGYKGNNISDFFKNQQKNLKSTAGTAAKVSKDGAFGTARRSLANSSGMDVAFNAGKDAQIKNIDKEWEENQRKFDEAQATRSDSIAFERERAEELGKAMETTSSSFSYNDGSGRSISYGSSESSFKNTVADNDTAYTNASIRASSFESAIQSKIASGGYSNDTAGQHQRATDQARLANYKSEATRAHREAEERASVAYKEQEVRIGKKAAEDHAKKLETESRQASTIHRSEAENHRVSVKAIEKKKL